MGQVAKGEVPMRLLEILKNNKSQVLILSAWHKAEEIAKQFNMSFLKKPFDLEALEKHLTERVVLCCSGS